MPHIFALSGGKSDKKSDGKLGSPELDADGCRWVKNKRTGCEMKLCKVGKSEKHRTGWAFTEANCKRSK